MQALLSDHIASISELKKNPSRLIQEAGGRPVAILNHNVAAAYLVPTKTFEYLMDIVDDHELSALAAEQLAGKDAFFTVDITKLNQSIEAGLACLDRGEKIASSIAFERLREKIRKTAKMKNKNE